MIKVYNRQEFGQVFEEMKPGLGSPDSPLWSPEHSLKPDQCVHFVCVRPLNIDWGGDVEYNEYWAWCGEQLAGYVRCFSSNDRNQEEWWGFTDESDIMLWVLKWAR